MIEDVAVLVPISIMLTVIIVSLAWTLVYYADKTNTISLHRAALDLAELAVGGGVVNESDLRTALPNSASCDLIESDEYRIMVKAVNLETGETRYCGVAGEYDAVVSLPFLIEKNNITCLSKITFMVRNK